MRRFCELMSGDRDRQKPRSHRLAASSAMEIEGKATKENRIGKVTARRPSPVHQSNQNRTDKQLPTENLTRDLKSSRTSSSWSKIGSRPPRALTEGRRTGSI